ncbi:DUF1015 domain-containing protein [Pseudoflavonifractor sp. 60]|uniref:DUF1015 domain-containing protein n=1 Tax=Pseudoflavonifractor sp. 60 TaxID=2304576 RepID=UPI0013705D1D|nr:DUF1015 domain-containing protein [Pseudoflavonifractor sp. 60]NBI66408.1 DUF1015 domain-containing protein [Pseudoflavonifractor sp. 60]
MTKQFEDLPFQPANILLPRDCDLSLWSVVACDQYTSRPEYWQRVEERVGRAPSALRLILPESCLEGPSVETDIMEINNTMSRYLREGRFQEYPDALIYVERTLDSGKVRRGLIGAVDLEQYDYEPETASAVRATEGTVLSRIPPRVAVRKNAPIELPHAMLLVDDPHRTMIEPLSACTEEMELLYDFELMERGGHIRGWLLTPELKVHVLQALKTWRDRVEQDLDGLLFAVGDGNHSLAAAKACYERRKGLTDPAQWPDLPSRYALCELVNLHDDSLEFEPIHRVVFGVRPEELLDALMRFYPSAVQGRVEGHLLPFVINRWSRGEITVSDPAARLPVATLQNFLDSYLAAHPKVRTDYIHGAEEACALAEEREDAVAFLLPSMSKGELFPTIIHDGVLPRKTFSMGEAHHKRFYLEARKIRT